MSRLPLVRSSFLAVALAVLALGVTHAAPLGAQAPAAIRVATLPIDTEAQPMYAEDLGLFKRAGLDASVSLVSNAQAIASAVLGGTYDFGQTDVTTVALAHEKGLPLVVVAPGAVYSSKAPTTVCVVAKNSPVKTGKDLDGTTVAVTGLFSFTRIAFSAWLDKNGADLNSVKFVELPFSAVPAALVGNRITAGTLSEPYLQKALDAGEVRLLSNCVDALAPQLLITVFFTTQEYAKAHPDVVKRFASALAESGRWGNAHHDESAQILKKWTKADVPSGMPRAAYADKLSADEIQTQIDAAARYKVLKASFRASELLLQ